MSRRKKTAVTAIDSETMAPGGSPVAVGMLREMIRADLELAFDHLNNEDVPLCRHELRNALARLDEIEALQSPPNLGAPRSTLHAPLIDVAAVTVTTHETENDQTHQEG